MIKPQKIDYLKEKNRFAKFLAEEIIPQVSRAQKGSHFPIFSAFEVESINKQHKYQKDLGVFLNYLKAQGPQECKSPEIENYLKRSENKIIQEIQAHKQVNQVFAANKKALKLF